VVSFYGVRLRGVFFCVCVVCVEFVCFCCVCVMC